MYKNDNKKIKIKANIITHSLQIKSIKYSIAIFFHPVRPTSVLLRYYYIHLFFYFSNRKTFIADGYKDIYDSDVRHRAPSVCYAFLGKLRTNNLYTI